MPARRSSRYRSQRPEDVAAANRWTREALKPHQHEWLFATGGPVCIDCGHVASAVERACLEAVQRDEGMRG